MKEQYFTTDTLDQQAHVFWEKILPLRGKHKYKIDPKVTALLIIDCQKFFFENTSHAFIPSARAILPKVVTLGNYCSQQKISVIKTQHLNTIDNAQIMQKWWCNPLPQKNNPLVAIIPEIAAVRGSTVVKSQYDAFYNSSLESILKSSNTKQLIITGVMTHLCCETTARVAFTRGYEVFFSIDGTATYNREFHQATLINLAHGFAIPLLIDEIINQLCE